MSVAHDHEHAEKKQKMMAAQKVSVPGSKCTYDILACDMGGSSVLNSTKPEGLATVLKPSAEGDAEPLTSDCDEQLLMTIAMAQPARIHSLRFKAPDADSAPQTVMLFANKTNISFDDVEDLKPTQTLTFKGAEMTLPLQFVKFQNVTQLTVFIKDNQGDVDATCLSALELIGEPIATTNMNDLKKGG